jgi:anti-sigma factor RsiW
MRPIDPAELSAFIDDELDTGRAAEVRAALATDAALRERYESLVHADAHMRSVAAGVSLHPQIRWPAPQASSRPRVPGGLWGVAPIALIPAAWLIGKLTEIESLALAASTLAFIALLVSVVRLVLSEEDGATVAAPTSVPGEN